MAALGSVSSFASGKKKPGSDMKFGLVTYLWGQKLDLPTLIETCEKSGCLGVELRTTHAHGVERTLNKTERKEVRKRFADSPVTNVGIGSNERYDNPDPEVVKKAIEATKEFIVLSRDVGGSGVKVKPDRFYPNVPLEKTVEQIAKSLDILGAFGADYGQQIRLEVHGKFAPPPLIKKIIDAVEHPNVGLCWNSNTVDVEGKGFESNFNLVKKRFGQTLHLHDLSKTEDYPYEKMFELLVEMDYSGWLLLEDSGKPKDVTAALGEQVQLFEKLRAEAQAKV